MHIFLKVLLIYGLIDILIFAVGYFFVRRQWKHHSEKEWKSFVYGNEVHVLPQKDLMIHLANDCSCSPRKYPVQLPDGTAKWQVVHNALDGRDL